MRRLLLLLLALSLTRCPSSSACGGGAGGDAGACPPTPCGDTIGTCGGDALVLPDGAPCPTCPGCDAGPTCPGCDAGADTTAPVPPAICEQSAEALTAANLRALRRFALHEAEAIIEGRLGAPKTVQDWEYAPLTIETVHYGWGFLAGTEVMIPLRGAQAEGLPSDEPRVIALSQSRPSPWDGDDRPQWSNPLAILSADEAAEHEDQIGYKAHLTDHVAVVRVVEQDEYRTTFEVVDALKGTFPQRFSDNWYADWGLPYPPPATDDGELWIASTLGLTEYEDGAVVIGSVYDLRPATDEHLARVMDALAHPDERFSRDAIAARRDEVLTAYRFHLAPRVVAAVVSGMAEECCTGAGGTFVQHDVHEVLRGDDLPPRFITGGHGYYGDEVCGDAYLHGLGDVIDPGPVVGEPFDCLQYPDTGWWDAYGPAIGSAAQIRLPTSDEGRARVEAWLAAAPPLLQLHDAQADPPGAAPEEVSDGTPWSTPMDAAEAFLVATHHVLITIEEVSGGDGEPWRVRFSTTLSRHEYDHLTRYEFALRFTCGDERLLAPGTRWIAPLVMLDPVTYYPEYVPDPGRGFLLPGVLVPEEAMSDQLASDLEHFAY